MKKLLLMLMFTGAFLWTTTTVNELLAQEMTELTVPDYSYGAVGAGTGTVTYWGITNPGPYGEKSTRGEERPYDVFFAHGWRWWQYVVNEFRCRDFPDFNFPGLHGYGFTSYGACPPMVPDIGDMASWGGVVVESASRQMWSLAGAVNNDNGPTEPYVFILTYPPSSIWGRVQTYCYLRKIVIVQSTGSLQDGDPVDIEASLTSQGVFGGDGDISDIGVLFLNKLSERPWLVYGGFGREYLGWGDVADILGNHNFMNNMLGNLVIYLNNTADTTATVAIGDTIVVEVAFNNEIKLDNPGIRDPGESEGWIGERPADLFTNRVYATNDSIRNMIKKHGNSLTYNLTCLTPGAFLEPLPDDGPNTDEDMDGISDAREKGPDGNDDSYDGNTDGLPDYQQVNVSSFHTYDGQDYVTLVVPEGTELSQLIVTDNPSPLDAPTDTDFNYGFFDFSIDGLEPGEAITVTLILHNAVSVDKYYKYGMTPDDPTPHWYEFMYDGQTGAAISGNVIDLYFTDGLRGDEDITVNGSIKEPGGPSKSITTGTPYLAEKSEIIIYPNPAGEYIIMQLNNILPANDYILRINSIDGKMMQEKLLDIHDANQEIVIPINDFPNGIFMISLHRNNLIYKSKFIKLE